MEWLREANAFAEYMLMLYFPWPAPGTADRFIWAHPHTGVRWNAYEELNHRLQQLQQSPVPAADADIFARARYLVDYTTVEWISAAALGQRVPEEMKHANARFRGRWAQRWEMDDPHRTLMHSYGLAPTKLHNAKAAKKVKEVVITEEQAVEGRRAMDAMDEAIAKQMETDASGPNAVVAEVRLNAYVNKAVNALMGLMPVGTERRSCTAQAVQARALHFRRCKSWQSLLATPRSHVLRQGWPALCCVTKTAT